MDETDVWRWVKEISKKYM